MVIMCGQGLQREQRKRMCPSNAQAHPASTGQTLSKEAHPWTGLQRTTMGWSCPSCHPRWNPRWPWQSLQPSWSELPWQPLLCGLNISHATWIVNLLPGLELHDGIDGNCRHALSICRRALLFFASSTAFQCRDALFPCCRVPFRCNQLSPNHPPPRSPTSIP